MTPQERGPEWRALAQQERFKWAANERADKAERDLGEALGTLALIAEGRGPAKEMAQAAYDRLARHPQEAPDDR